MKKKLVALYDPYLDVLGGGEKHILSILKVLEDEDYDINIFWDSNLQDDFKVQLDLSFKYLVTFHPVIFKNKSSFLKKLLLLKKFDYFFYVTDGSYFISSAKNNFVFCMVPKRQLYNMNLLNKIKTSNWRFITNSYFTNNWLAKWGIDSTVIYPYLDNDFIEFKIEELKKEKIILTVGRFFTHLHTKKHDLIIKLFKKIKSEHSQMADFKLILAGGLKKEDQEYFNNLKKIVNNDPSISLETNISYSELLSLYKKSLLYWHFTGFGIDENKNPQLLEHLGITPLEAMASGCLTFVYNAGGPKELITDGENGFLFQNEDELFKKTLAILKNQAFQKKIQKNAKKYVVENFSYKVFKQKVKEVIL